MADAAIHMLDDSLTAFLQRDVELVKLVCEHDDIVDDEFKVLREQTLQLAKQDPTLISAASYTLLILTSVERIADHTTNIAERVAYMETGQMRRLAREHRLSLTHFS